MTPGNRTEPFAYRSTQAAIGITDSRDEFGVPLLGLYFAPDGFVRPFIEGRLEKILAFIEADSLCVPNDVAEQAEGLEALAVICLD